MWLSWISAYTCISSSNCKLNHFSSSEERVRAMMKIGHDSEKGIQNILASKLLMLSSEGWAGRGNTCPVIIQASCCHDGLQLCQKYLTINSLFTLCFPLFLRLSNQWSPSVISATTVRDRLVDFFWAPESKNTDSPSKYKTSGLSLCRTCMP